MPPLITLLPYVALRLSGQNKEQEKAKVDKELANIRSRFSEKDLDGYNKKKYVWKLIYMYMLGYEVDFGYMEAINLVASHKYTEKSVVRMRSSNGGRGATRFALFRPLPYVSLLGFTTGASLHSLPWPQPSFVGPRICTRPCSLVLYSSSLF